MTATLLNCVDGPSLPILSFSKSISHLAMGSQDNFLYIVLLDTMEITQRFEFNDSVTHVQFYNQELLIVASLDGQLTYFVLIDNEFKKQRSQTLSSISHFQLYKKKIYVISEDSIAYILQGSDLNIINALSVDGITSSAVCGDYIAFGGVNLELYDIKRNEIIDKKPLNGNSVVSLIGNSQRIILGTDDGKIKIFSIRNGKLLENESQAPQIQGQVLVIKNIKMETYEVTLIGGDECFLCLEQNLQLRYQNNLKTGVCAIEICGKYAVCGCTDGQIIVFDILKGEKICNFQGIVPLDEENLCVSDLQIIDGNLLVTGDNYLYVYATDFDELQKRQADMQEASNEEEGEVEVGDS